MTDAEHCKPIADVLAEVEGVESSTVAVHDHFDDGRPRVIRVHFTGAAEPGSVFARLNFHSPRLTPQGCTLLVHKDRP